MHETDIVVIYPHRQKKRRTIVTFKNSWRTSNGTTNGTTICWRLTSAKCYNCEAAEKTMKSAVKSDDGYYFKKDKGQFLMLFNRDGYVLDFNSNEFDVFTANSIDVALCAAYRMSEGKSPAAYG